MPAEDEIERVMILQRLAVLEADIETAKKEKKPLEETYGRGPRDVGRPPQPDSLPGRIQARRERDRQGWREATEAQGREYEAQLERVAPEVGALTARIDEIAGKRTEIQRRHDAELESLAVEAAKLCTPHRGVAEATSSQAGE
jgi:hypothetical protein